MTAVSLSVALTLSLWLGPEASSERPATWDTQLHAGLQAAREGRYDEAEGRYREAEAVARGFGPHDPRLAQTLALLGRLYTSQARWEEAEATLEEARGLCETALGPESPDVASVLVFLGNLRRDQGRYGDAERAYRRSLEIAEDVLGPQHLGAAQALDGLAGVHRLRGEIHQEALGPDHPALATSVENRVFVLRKLDRQAEADELAAWAQAIRRRHAARDGSR